MKAIIYYRKSTDRDDKQANSLEHQLDNCRRVAELKSLEIYKEIWESRSAKTEWTRPWFNELIKLCKTWKINYIIIDEPKRLSRNNIDTSRIIDLLDKKQLIWILWTSREYKADNSRDKFLLQLDLSLSKMDNEDRAKDIKDKMDSCIARTWRFLWKSPFWYKNITIKKWHKEIIVDKLESKIVKEIFSLRLENKAFSTIAYIIEKKYWKKINLSFEANRIHKLVAKKFYYWVFSWNWKDVIWSHKPLITKEIYDKANWVWKWIHQKIETLIERGYKGYTLKWFIKDSSW
jgi:site-specific DNA recombinase